MSSICFEPRQVWLGAAAATVCSHVEGITLIEFMEDYFAGFEGNSIDFLGQIFQLTFVESPKQGNHGQMPSLVAE